VYCACSNARFWGQIGRHLDPECVRDPRAKTLLRACAAVVQRTGEGPSKSVLVIQQLQSSLDDGKLPRAEYDAAVSLLEDVEDLDGGIPKAEELAEAAGPVLRRRAHDDIVRRILVDHGKGKSLARYAAEIDEAERIGLVSSVGSVAMSTSIWAGIAELQRAERLPLGVAQIDSALGGGVMRRTLTTIGADTNVGKTSMLVHVACNAYVKGMRVLFIPTEEGANETLIRMAAWLTDIPIERVGRIDQEAVTRLEGIASSSAVGTLVVEFLPQGSTVPQLQQTIARVREEHEGFSDGYDLLIVDYADKLEGRGERAYDRMKSVYEGLRQIAVDDGTWVMTASQLKSPEGGKRKGPPTANDLSDSMWKGRTSDNVITMWRDEDGDASDRFYCVAKSRGPGVGSVVGPVPAMLDRSRMVPVHVGASDVLVGDIPW